MPDAEVDILCMDIPLDEDKATNVGYVPLDLSFYAKHFRIGKTGSSGWLSLGCITEEESNILVPKDIKDIN